MSKDIKQPLALTIDIGTQSCRVALVDKTGRFVDLKKVKYQPTYYSSQNNYCEQNPDYYFECICEGIRELVKDNKNILTNIIGATITTFRDSSVQLDENNKPLRKCILWCDQRTGKAKEKLPLLHRTLFKLSGMWATIDLNRKRTIAHWLKENEPEIWAKTKKYVNISTYLTYKLTGNLVDSSGSIIGHYPLDFKKRTWYKEGALKARIYGIPSSMLCDIAQPGEILGEIEPNLAKKLGLPSGIKLFASGSDKACETVGLGALNNDYAAISYGTASTVEISSKTYHNPEPFLPAYPAAVPGWYNLDVQIYRGYWMLSWFAREFAKEELDNATVTHMPVEELLNKKIAKIAPGSDGLVLQPYWGPGLRRPLARGAIVGFTEAHTKLHLYRAILEGIGYALREAMEGIEKRLHHKVKEIRISGGGSQSDVVCQITADLFNLPVSRVQTFETSTLGAAMTVFLATNEFGSIEETTNAMVHKGKTFMPNSEVHAEYEYLFRNVYLKMFPKLNNLYKSLKKK